MKKLQILFVVAMATFFMVGNVYNLQAGFPKVPLMERFTEASCSPCSTYNSNGYTNWTKMNAENLAIITYHTWWPGGGSDPLYRFDTTLSRIRVTDYGSKYGTNINGVPYVTFNGKTALNGQPTNAALDDLLSVESAKTVPVKITPTITMNSEGIATVNVEVFSEEAMSNVRLQVLILQELVEFSSPPGSNSEKEFRFVARFALPDMNGEEITLTANQTIMREFIRDLSTVTQSGSFYVVAFLEEMNSAHNIVQAGKSDASVTIHPMVVNFLQTPYYSKVPNETDNYHLFIVDNPNSFPVRVTTTVEVDETGDWIMSDEIPAIIDIAANSADTTIIELKSGIKPSGHLLGINFSVKSSENTDGKVYVYVTNFSFFYTMTDNTKYAYLTGLGSSPVTVDALNNATYFDGELVKIPLVANIGFLNTICMNGLLDGLDFLGISFYGTNLLVCLINNIPIASKISAIHNAGGKLYMENDDNYYSLNVYKNSYSFQYTAAEQLFKNCFGVWNTTGNDITIYNTQTGAPFAVTIKGVDEEISKETSYQVNGQQPYYGYMEQIEYLDPAASAVFTYSINPFSNIPVMAKFEKNNNARSVASGVRIASFPVADRPVIANNIVDWLFNVNGIIEANPNLDAVNGLTLAVYPNPVESTSNLTITNTGEMDVNGRIYVLDETGSEVAQIYEGMLNIGDNVFSLSNTLLPAGKYFVIAENSLGKTYTSVLIRK